jgi:hypothetical protein
LILHSTFQKTRESRPPRAEACSSASKHKTQTDGCRVRNRREGSISIFVISTAARIDFYQNRLSNLEDLDFIPIAFNTEKKEALFKIAKEEERTCWW